MNDAISGCVRMGRLVVLLAAGFAAAASAGCAGTRYPSFRPMSLDSERRQAELFYPFGEEGSGPAMEAQPREYAVPRSEATRLQRSNQFYIP